MDESIVSPFLTHGVHYSLPEFSVAGGVVFGVEYGAVIVEKADVVSVIRRTQTYDKHD